MALFTPVNQRRHTNVAIVRLKRGGKRFELAAYPNKVQGWRNGIEKSLDEVLQTPKIFINVSQGEYAKKEDLKAAFDTEDTDAIIKIILDKGEIQVSEKERTIMLESLFKDIATVVSEKCVDPSTKRPIPVGNVERAMRDMHYSVNPHRNAKQQALEVIRLLKERIPIERAQMQLKIVGPAAASKVLKEKLTPLYSAVEKEETEGKYECICFIDPVNFRKIEETLKTEGKGTATVEVISLAAFKETSEKALPSGSGEEADDEDDKAKAETAEDAGKKPQPQVAQRRRGQKMPGEPDSDDSSDDNKKGKAKKGARKKKPAAIIVTTKPVPKGKAAPKPSVSPSDDSEELEELAQNMQVMALKQPLPKRSALTSGSEAEAEDAAKPAVPKGKGGGKAKGKAKGRAPVGAFSALADDV